MMLVPSQNVLIELYNYVITIHTFIHHCSNFILQPMVIHSSLGAGRAGCIAAVAIAKVLIQSESEPWAWDSDSNLLDQVSGL